MVERRRSSVAAVLGAALLLIGSVGSVAAAGRPARTFDATFCYATEFQGVSPAIVATVTWSNQSVTEVGIGTGDGTGAGFGAVTPLAHPSRSGSFTVGIGADDTNIVAGADIRFHDTVLDSEEIDIPGSSWSGLPAC